MTQVELLKMDMTFIQMKEILKLLDKDLFDKIPEKIKSYIVNYKSINNYTFKYDRNKKLNEQLILEEAKDLIAYFDYYYWADENGKAEIEGAWKRNSSRKKENPVNTFEFTKSIDTNIKKENVYTIPKEIPLSEENEEENEKLENVQTVNEVATRQNAHITNIPQAEETALVVKQQGFFAKLICKFKSIFKRR